MIRNDEQYGAAINERNSIIARLNKTDEPANTKELVRRRERLRRLISDYESLVADGIDKLEPLRVDEQARLLIQWRIAAGWTVNDLAHAAGMKTEQLLRHEETFFKEAPLGLVSKLAGLVQSSWLPQSQRSILKNTCE